MPANCFAVMSSPAHVRELLPEADLVVGAVLVPGSRTPVLITREMLGAMKPGTVLVDVAIDQGGCFETSRETTHSEPTFILDNVVHYAVSNMAGAVPRTSTQALTNATLPYALEIADKGWKTAMRDNNEIKCGANVINGDITYEAVAETFDLAFVSVDALL
jgi:alanine dehydrogenase